MADDQSGGQALPATGHENETRAVPRVVLKLEPTQHPVAGRELLQHDAGDVRAEHLAMEKSGAETVEADRVTMTRSGAKSVVAKSVQADDSGILTLRADTAALLQSSAVAVVATTARLSRSRVAFLKADRVELDPASRVLVQLGPVAGGGRPVLGPTGAAALGAAFAAVLTVLGAAVRKRSR